MRKLALVVDTNDEDKKGKARIRILPEMRNMKEEYLPWATPQHRDRSGASKEKSYIHQVPEINSLVYCEVSDDWTTFEYTSEIPYIGAKYSYEENVDSILTSIEDLEEQTYPQPSYTATKDGTIQFINTDTGEQGLVHPSGTFLYIRPNGSVKVRSMETTLEILENGSIQVTGTNISFLFDNENKKFILTDVDNVEIGGASDFAVLFSPLKEILEKLLEHNHVAPTGPTTPAQESSGAPLSSLKSKLADLQSIIKTE